jgi:hypothetical protein
MEWHWFYLIGIICVVVNIWALVADHGPEDPELEQMWNDNF